MQKAVPEFSLRSPSLSNTFVVGEISVPKTILSHFSASGQTKRILFIHNDDLAIWLHAS